MASTVRPFLTDRRGYIVGLSSMLGGSALAWWSASATWVLVERSLLGDSTSSEMTDVQAVGLLAESGGSVVSIAAAAPIIGFAGLAGVIGSRGWLRRVVGVVVAIAGIAPGGTSSLVTQVDWQFAGVGLLLGFSAFYALRLSARAKLKKLGQKRTTGKSPPTGTAAKELM